MAVLIKVAMWQDITPSVSHTYKYWKKKTQTLNHMPHNHLKNRNNTNHCLFEESPTTVYVFWLCATPLLYADAQDTPAHPRS